MNELEKNTFLDILCKENNSEELHEFILSNGKRGKITCPVIFNFEEEEDNESQE